jgi:hypothetical protein
MHGGKLIEIRNFLEWGSGTLFRNHNVGGCGFSGRGFDTHGCFLGLAAAGLEAAEVLGSELRGLAVFLVAVTLGCSGVSVTGWEG